MQFKNIIMLIILSCYLAVGCSTSHDHSHDNHEHSSANDHKQVGADHDHNFDEPTLSSKQPPEGTEKSHAEAHDHSHSEDVINIEEEWAQLIGLKTVEVKRMPLELMITAPGKLIANPDKFAIISPFVNASINCVFKNIGDQVQQGELLVCLSSPEVGILRAEYERARAELEIENQNHARKLKLHQENIISDRQFQDAILSQKLAEVNLSYARKKLLALGVTEQELIGVTHQHVEATGSTLHLYAPISGVITRRDVSIGQKVDRSSNLFEIIDSRRLWLEADVFEKDLMRIRIGQEVKISVTAYPDLIFKGKIFYIGSTLKPDTKTINIIAEVQNLAGKLLPGMFSTTQIVIGSKQKVLAAPRSAILEEDNLKIVFVKVPGGYCREIVKTGIVADEFVEIVSGLHDGDIVVTQGNYQLKSKSQITGVDPHAGHVH
ncbi:MAG: efflux RND transporter periplasmic adaptor subunit [bacterium]|nr:efflux RND transporter periplasmic adaptor subunit [bacterium]